MNDLQIKPINLSLKSALTKSKIYITGLAVANAFRNKLPMFMIGKAKKQWCSKNMKCLSCRYKNQ